MPTQRSAVGAHPQVQHRDGHGVLAAREGLRLDEARHRAQPRHLGLGVAVRREQPGAQPRRETPKTQRKARRAKGRRGSKDAAEEDDFFGSTSNYDQLSLMEAADEATLKDIDKDIKAVVTAAADFAQASEEPDPSELYTDILVEA